MKRCFVVMSPRCSDMPVTVFLSREDALKYFSDMYPSRHDADTYIRNVQFFPDGYIGVQRRRDARL